MTIKTGRIEQWDVCTIAHTYIENLEKHQK